MDSLANTSYLIFVSARPRQWLKNLSVFAAIFFGGSFLDRTEFTVVFFVFVIFCFLSSSIYLFNDVIDAEADRIHFSKKNRPIASGDLSKKTALLVSAILAFLGLYVSFLISEIIVISALIFLLIQIFYSLKLKKLLILDIMAIAFLFMLRVFAGSFVINEPLSSWLILTVLMLSLFLAIGKRRSEVTLLSQPEARAHRSTLSHYPIALLDGLTFMMATASLLTYSLFTFNTERVTASNPIANYLPETLASSRWLMLTIPFVIYGVFRYLYLIFEKKEGESPEKILLTDLPLFTTVALWILTIFIFIYVFNV